MPGTIVVRQELLTDAVARLSWQLNNKIILLTHNTSSVSAWDIYRASPSLGARVLHLGSSPSPTLTQHWAADNGPLLTALGRDPWYRRTNLTGLVLRCSVLPYKPFSDITLHSDGTVTVRGLIGDLWDLLQSVTGFTVAVVVQKARQNEGTSNYTREFTWDSWTAVAVFYAVCVIAMIVFTRVHSLETTSPLSFSIITNIRIFCNMGFGDEAPRSLPYRTWLLTTVLMVAVLHVCYSSFLITMLTDNSVKLPFQNLFELHNKRERYTFGVEKDSLMELDVKYSTTPPWQPLWRDIIRPNPHFLETAEEGIARVADSPYHAFLVSAFRYFTTDLFNCSHVQLPEKYFMSFMAMPLCPGGPANPILNHVLKQMQMNGMLHRLFVKFNVGRAPWSCDPPHSAPFGLEETYTAFQMLTFGLALSLLLLGLEILWKKSTTIT